MTDHLILRLPFFADNRPSNFNYSGWWKARRELSNTSHWDKINPFRVFFMSRHSPFVVDIIKMNSDAYLGSKSL